MIPWSICFSLAHFTEGPSIFSQIAGCHSHGWVIFHYIFYIIYTTSLSIYTCWLALKLFLYCGCCEEHCIENGSADIILSFVFIPLDIYPEVGFLGHMVLLFLIFWGTHYTFKNNGLYQFTLLLVVYRVPFSIYLTNTCYLCSLFNNSHSDRYELIFHCGFNLHSPDD